MSSAKGKLFVGGCADGELIALDPYSVRIKRPVMQTCELYVDSGPFGGQTGTDRIELHMDTETYERMTFVGDARDADPKLFTIMVPVGTTGADALQMLLDGYRRPHEGRY